MDEVGSAVFAIALVLIAVFVPTAFIPGITGQFYLQFAITIAVSTAISAFNSLTLSPALAALLMKPHHERAPRRAIVVARFGRRMADGFNRGFERLSAYYGRVVRRLVGSGDARHHARDLRGARLCHYFMLERAARLHPAMDQGYAIVVVQLPEGASLARTDAVIQRARRSSARPRACTMPWRLPASLAQPSPTPAMPA